VAQVLALEKPATMADGPKLMLHALPVDPLDEVWARFLPLKDHEVINSLSVIGGNPATWRFNMDGFVIHTLRTDPSRQCYTQLFRSGGIEAVSGSVLAKDARNGGFYPWGMEERVIGAVTVYQKFWERIGVTPPLLVGLTLSGVKGWRALRGPTYGELEGGFDRDVVAAPEVVLSDLATPPDILLRPLFDFVWNGGGWPGSPNYRDGRWVAPR
jgi:hypothetical protein